MMKMENTEYDIFEIQNMLLSDPKLVFKASSLYLKFVPFKGATGLCWCESPEQLSSDYPYVFNQYSLEDRFTIVNPKREIDELQELSKPLQDWLIKNFNPHCKIEIEQTSAKVVEDALKVMNKVND